MSRAPHSSDAGPDRIWRPLILDTRRPPAQRLTAPSGWQRPPPPHLLDRLTAVGLLISPYLEPADAARLMWQVQFLRGATAGLLGGWVVLLGIAAYHSSVPASLKVLVATAWAAVTLSGGTGP